MKNLLPVNITKMSGAGNTFALIDARKNSDWEKYEKQLGITRAEFAKLVCDKVLGVSADGLLLIQSGSVGFDFEWDFYNSDGSGAEMCGNAARCAARFCRENLMATPEVSFKTGAGLVTAKILDNGKIQVRMPEAKVLQARIELKTKSSSTEVFTLVNTGVPHLVQKIHKISDSVSLKSMAQEARSHHDLKPAGANVTFYAESAPGKINAVTFERGVEDYTLACGTGAVAAAMVYGNEIGLNNVEVQMPGGVMSVDFSNNDTHPLMTGDAVFVGDFKYYHEVVG